MEVASYTRCRYEGGFIGMKASNKATLVLADDRVSLQRPRVFFGSRKNNVMKVWARWSAVLDLDVVGVETGGTRIEITTKTRGTGRVVVPTAEPIEIWGALDRVDDLRGRIPPRVRKALDGEASLEDDIPLEEPSVFGAVGADDLVAAPSPAEARAANGSDAGATGWPTTQGATDSGATVDATGDGVAAAAVGRTVDAENPGNESGESEVPQAELGAPPALHHDQPSVSEDETPGAPPSTAD
jgi:hypothetical protein